MRHISPEESARIADYLASELDPTQIEAFEQWIAEQPERQMFLAYLQRSRCDMRSSTDERDIAARIDMVSKSLQQQIAPLPTHAISSRHNHVGMLFHPFRRTVGTWVRVGSVAMLAGIAAILFVARRDAAPRSAPSSVREYATIAGQQATVTLADGSRITLAPQSRLRVPAHFAVGTREISLDGEAYFDVVTAPHLPFVVHTRNVATRVLGTTFDIRRYATDTVVRVAVITGKVASGGRGTPVVLSAGAVGHISDTTAIASLAGDVANYTAWTSGRLVFNNAPASEILATVGRWYDVEFHCNDTALTTRRFSTVFKVAEREKTLTAIQALLNVTMTFAGRTITLYPRKMSQNIDSAQRHKGHEGFASIREVGR